MVPLTCGVTLSGWRDLNPPNTPPLTCAFTYFRRSKAYKPTRHGIIRHWLTSLVPPPGAPMIFIYPVPVTQLRVRVSALDANPS